MKPSPSEIAGALIREHVDAPTDRKDHAVQRARLIDRVARKPGRQRVWVTLVAVSAVNLIIIALFLATRSWGEAKPITFQVGPGEKVGATGNYVTAAEHGEVTLDFSEGTRITLHPSAKARVAKTTARGASFVLETGQARFDVVPREKNDWTVSAGPYTIRVKGTSFEATWSVNTGVLEVKMIHGVVVVQGPGVESGIEVRDNQRFVSSTIARIDNDASTPLGSASVGTAIVEPSWPVGSVPSADPGVICAVPGSGTASALPTHGESGRPVSGPSLVADNPGAPQQPTAATPEPAASSVPQESWSSLSARGQYAAVVSQAESRGLDSVYGSASESELFALANASRYVGKHGVAQRALSAVRSRFAGGTQAASAAFLLGRMSEDGGNLGQAIRWYDTYLSEAPGGALAPEAMGRSMAAWRKSGNEQAAKRSAEAYLKRFPAGPYAGLAREIVNP